jgi:VCBS repeat-containing protein
MQFDWEILDVDSKEGVITSAHYEVKGTEEDVTLSTQGHWYFAESDAPKISFDNVTKNDVIDWVMAESSKDGVNLIESNLQKQLESLKEQSTKKTPWGSAIFTPFA